MIVAFLSGLPSAIFEVRNVFEAVVVVAELAFSSLILLPLVYLAFLLSHDRFLRCRGHL
jgi:hypothetical protein